MAIRVRCECGSRLEAPDELAGRQAVCGKCGRVLSIRAEAEPEAAPSNVAKSEREIGGPRMPNRVVQKKKARVYQPLPEPDEVRSGRKRKKRRPAKVGGSGSGTKRSPSLIDTWLRAVKFPFRREAVITIAVLSCLYGPLVGGLASAPAIVIAGAMGPRTIAAMLLFTGGIMGYFCYFLFQTLRAAASNDDDLPVAVAFDLQEIFLDAWLMFGCSVVLFTPVWLLETAAYFLGFSIPVPVTLGLTLLLIGLWPMAVTSASLHTTVLAANHWTVIQAVLRIPLQYGLTLLVAGLMMVAGLGMDYAVSWGFSAALPHRWYIQMFAWIFSWFLNFAVATACMYLAGNLYYHNRKRIGWFLEAQPRY